MTRTPPVLMWNWGERPWSIWLKALNGMSGILHFTFNIIAIICWCVCVVLKGLYNYTDTNLITKWNSHWISGQQFIRITTLYIWNQCFWWVLMTFSIYVRIFYICALCKFFLDCIKNFNEYRQDKKKYQTKVEHKIYKFYEYPEEEWRISQ